MGALVLFLESHFHETYILIAQSFLIDTKNTQKTTIGSILYNTSLDSDIF